MAKDINKWNANELDKLERLIKKEYKNASDELSQRTYEYLNGWDEIVKGKKVHHAGYYERAEKEFLAMQRGEYTPQQYKAWMTAQLGRGQHWERLADASAQRYAKSAEYVADLVNNKMSTGYAKNFNFVQKLAKTKADAQHVNGIDFEMVNERALRHLLKGSLPYETLAINLPREYTWNLQKLQSLLVQGIIQGDSTERLAQRMLHLSDMNRGRAVRNARTAWTGAMNAGKQDSFSDLASKGCTFTKIWHCVHDNNARTEHQKADGQEVDYNEPFEVGGEELMYPADRKGSPWNIYNCRCQMTTGEITFHSILTDKQKRKAGITIYG